jgi:hypothetical protein
MGTRERSGQESLLPFGVSPNVEVNGMAFSTGTILLQDIEMHCPAAEASVRQQRPH